MKTHTPRLLKSLKFLGVSVFFCLLTSFNVLWPVITAMGGQMYSPLNSTPTTYDCSITNGVTNTTGCKVEGSNYIKLTTSYSGNLQCNYVLSVHNGRALFIPGRTQNEYQAFVNWAAINANVLTFHQGCDDGGWGPWSGCKNACGSCTETRQCLYLVRNQTIYSGAVCIGDSSQTITATGGCTGTWQQVGCSVTCGGGQTTPTCVGGPCDNNTKPAPISCNAQSCSICGNGKIDPGEYCDGGNYCVNCQACAAESILGYGQDQCPSGHRNCLDPAILAAYGCLDIRWSCYGDAPNRCPAGDGGPAWDADHNGWCWGGYEGNPNFWWEECGANANNMFYWCRKWAHTCIPCPNSQVGCPGYVDPCTQPFPPCGCDNSCGMG